MSPMTFRNSKIVYYGPHSCENCGVNIARMGTEFGGTAFTYPEGPIYPNTEWHPHVCDQELVLMRKSMAAESIVTESFSLANAVMLNRYGWVVLGEHQGSPEENESLLVISPNQTFYDFENAAWIGALDRIDRKLPTWHINLNKYGVHSKVPEYRNGLDALPQMPAAGPVTNC